MYSLIYSDNKFNDIKFVFEKTTFLESVVQRKNKYRRDYSLTDNCKKKYNITDIQSLKHKRVNIIYAKKLDFYNGDTYDYKFDFIRSIRIYGRDYNQHISVETYNFMTLFNIRRIFLRFSCYHPNYYYTTKILAALHCLKHLPVELILYIMEFLSYHDLFNEYKYHNIEQVCLI